MMIEDDDKGSTTIQHPRDYCQIFKLTFFHRLQPATRYVSSQKLAHSTWLLCMYVAFKSRPYSTTELPFFKYIVSFTKGRCNYGVHIFQIQQPTFFVICTRFIRLMVPTGLVGAVKSNTKAFKQNRPRGVVPCTSF